MSFGQSLSCGDIIIDADGKTTKECKGCGFFYDYEMFKPIYDKMTLLENGKRLFRLTSEGKTNWCEYCQDRMLKSGRMNL